MTDHYRKACDLLALLDKDSEGTDAPVLATMALAHAQLASTTTRRGTPTATPVAQAAKGGKKK